VALNLSERGYPAALASVVIWALARVGTRFFVLRVDSQFAPEIRGPLFASDAERAPSITAQLIRDISFTGSAALYSCSKRCFAAQIVLSRDAATCRLDGPAYGPE
jgi:hypothetical protein